ncbi:MAG: hypothetical protein N2662_12310 [Bacteroidales bacterium]|nr:hypothetical protein [Bacteroidales bacterium]
MLKFLLKIGWFCTLAPISIFSLNGQYFSPFSKEQRIEAELSLLHKKSYHSAFAPTTLLPDSNHISFRLYPLLNGNSGFSTSQKLIYCFSPGFYSYIPLGKKAYSWIMAAINYEKYPYLLSASIDTNQILPEGNKAIITSNDAYLKAIFLGEIGYMPLKYIQLNGGYGKKHWGDGYRSLWLSDYSAYYPYVQLKVNFWRIEYHILWAYLRDIDTQAKNTTFLDKYGVFHFFDFKPSSRLSFGFFESIIWWSNDANTHRGIDPSYLNPVIFFRPVEYAMHSPDNANLGLHGTLRLWKKTILYQQLFIDDLSIKKIIDQPQWWGNKYGILAGVKFYQLMGIPGLYVQIEYSRVRPFTYSHSSSALNYGTNYQPLGHPLGANFYEYLTVLRYRKGSWSILSKCSWAVQGRDTSTFKNIGQNIYRSYLQRSTINNEAPFLQGQKHHLFFGELRIYRSLSQKFPLKGFIGTHYTYDKTAIGSTKELVFRIGITANFFNDERDYR